MNDNNINQYIDVPSAKPVQSAAAEQTTTPQTPPAPTIKLQLTLDEINVVLAGLGELPAKISLPVIEKVRNQAMVQLQQTQQA